jgi:peptide/nickel transport system substrate-binding protein
MGYLKGGPFMTRKAAIFVVIMSLVIVSLSGCSDVPVQEQPPTKVETPVKGGILNLGTTLPIQTLNPVISGESNGELTNLLFNGLIKVDKNLSYRSDLAESWHVSENGLEWTLKLRSDVKWHDGMPVTADDIIFTLDYALDTRVKSPWAQELSNIARYEQPDASTIMFELYQPDSAFLYTMRIKILPKHVFQGQDILTFDFNQNPVGTGPFKFKNWDLTTNTIELIANEEYFGNSPYISDIKFKIFESEDEQESAFKSGKLDAMPISVENWSIYQEMKDVQLMNFQVLAMNL